MSLDGVVSLGVPGTTDGDAISGGDMHDSMVMGLLRSVSDAVIIGAGTLSHSPQHLWTPEYVFPALEGSYRDLRSRLGKTRWPSCAVVTARGDLDPDLAVFKKGNAALLIITTPAGEKRLSREKMPSHVRVVTAGGGDRLSVREILDAVGKSLPDGDTFLVEGGPRLLGQFIESEELDELYLTLSPRLAGRDDHGARPGLLSGVRLLPERIVAGKINGIRKSDSHLFLRYAFTP
jgi:riboflavin biosynthesis pyrimidine reductase